MATRYLTHDISASVSAQPERAWQDFFNGPKTFQIVLVWCFFKKLKIFKECHQHVWHPEIRRSIATKELNKLTITNR